MINRKIAVLLIITLFFPLFIKAQTFDETIAKLSTIAAQKYIDPAISAFGSNLNSGWVNQVPQAKMFGFDLNFKIVGMGTFLNDKAKTFSTDASFRFTSAQADEILAAYASSPNYAAMKQEFLNKDWQVNFSGPTIIGKSSDHLKIFYPGGIVGGQQVAAHTEDVPDVKGLLDELQILPTGAPQVTIGTIMGTEVSVRYLPEINNDKLGKITFSGFGIIHNPATWLSNPLPVDIGLGYFYQKLKVGTILESTATQYGIFVSKTIGTTIALIPYAGYTMETSKTTITYNFVYNTVVNGTVVATTSRINFDMDGENSSAFLVGAAIKLAIINLNVDYKMAKYNTLSAGVSFGF